MDSESPPRGVYAPVNLFFHEDETIDFEALSKHIVRLAQARLAGLVISGSNGEAVHLSRAERAKIINFTRSTLDEEGFSNTAIIAGCGCYSTWETIEICKEAADAGAKWALVLPPGYWVAAMTKAVIKKFFADVAEASPLPILLYNFPGVTSGIDLDSDTVIELASNPRIVGMKFTCCNLGKMQRITSNVSSAESFRAMVGKSEAFLPGLVAGSGGLIGGLVNLAPKVHMHLLELYDNGKLAEAQKIQALLSDADWALIKLGVSGLKVAIHQCYGYGAGRSRNPLGIADANAWSSATVDLVEKLTRLEDSL